MFGLPLLISYYAVGEGLGAAPLLVLAYLVVSLTVGLLLLLKRSQQPGEPRAEYPDHFVPGPGAFSRFGPVAALSSATVAVISFGLMRYLLAVSYPYPSNSADFAGGVYVVALSAAATVGIPYAVAWGFPVVRRALAEGKLRVAAYLIGAAYFLTYEILVNEVVITGYNTTPGNFVQSPLGSYPFAYVFTSGPSPGNFLETAIYTPYVLVQLSPYVNFIFQPFELILAVAMSVLVATTVVVTYHTFKQSERMGGACSVSATLSGVGAFMGYTATCPSCLAPTLISVVFGGLATVQHLYSDVWAAVLPPLVSVLALLISMYLLSSADARKVRTSAGGGPVLQSADRP